MPCQRVISNHMIINIDLVNDWKNNDNILHTKIIDRAKTHSMSSYTIFIKEMIIIAKYVQSIIAMSVINVLR